MPKLLTHLRLAALENEAVLLEARPVALQLARLVGQGTAEAVAQEAHALAYLGVIDLETAQVRVRRSGARSSRFLRLCGLKTEASEGE